MSVGLTHMTWKKIFVAVTSGALIGMLLGGLFGFGAGRIAPEFFRRLIPWQEVEPVGLATFFGATAGVILGGALGAFAIVVQTMLEWKQKARG